ncbi:hypothetical protein HN832_01150 [archaeon]|jgi:KH domain-containing protein|nr:hypothetical protein [archaeon]MBT4373818.1 hypothetical protein [archaeon]MBT4532284.1 hypothetical protein [archaeon]MBT7001109.1 hypothetical protein [archaeon]MBT7281998.1 hypothetical protein [archaeon]
MKTILSEKIARIIKNKKRLEKTLEIKITNRGKEVTIQGEPENEYIAEKVIDALNFGFPYSAAMTIKTEETTFEIINIKDYTKRKDLESIRARIIGKAGKTLSTLSQLSEGFLELKDNEVGVIGPPENIPNVTKAIISIIKGSKQSNVYAYLERNKPLPAIDLGLREKK